MRKKLDREKKDVAVPESGQDKEQEISVKKEPGCLMRAVFWCVTALLDGIMAVSVVLSVATVLLPVVSGFLVSMLGIGYDAPLVDWLLMLGPSVLFVDAVLVVLCIAGIRGWHKLVRRICRFLMAHTG